MTYAKTLQDQLAEFDELWPEPWHTSDKIDALALSLGTKLTMTATEAALLQQETYRRNRFKTFLTSFAEKIAQSVREEDTDYIRTKFLLRDWSGEAEVYEELIRLASEIEALTTLATLKK